MVQDGTQIGVKNIINGKSICAGTEPLSHFPDRVSA